MKWVFITPGGMGDWAPMSTLPERLVVECGDTVCWYGHFRNDGIRQFWLRDNPYVQVTLERPTHRMQFGDHHQLLLAQHMSNVAAHEAFFGLAPPYSTQPKIYWTPQSDDRFAGKVLIDPSGITTPYTKDAFEAHLIQLRQWGLFGTDDMLVVEPPSQAIHGARIAAAMPDEIFPECERWQPEDVFEMASAIASCRIFATNESGGAAMAVAIRAKLERPRIIGIITNRTFNRLEWRWPGIDYWVTSQLGADW